MHERVAFDAHALIAWFRNEPAAERVEQVLRDGQAGRTVLMLSVVNLGEVIYTIERKNGQRSAARALNILRQLPLEMVELTRRRALRAARLKAHYRLGYADAFAAALAAEFNATLLTGDTDFRAVEGLIAVEWLPSR